MQKPFSQSCQNNQAPILAVIKTYFKDAGIVLEIGSGTGQHAAYFAEKLPHITWQPSDVETNITGIELWGAAAALANWLPPFVLNVDDEWPKLAVSGVFSANTTHIMHWQSVTRLFAGVAHCLNGGGYFCLYGPFNENGKCTSDSNRRFDAMLRTRDPHSGIRDFTELQSLADSHSLEFIAGHTMPANNRILVWKKTLCS